MRKDDLTDVTLGWTNLSGAGITDVRTNKQDELLKCLRIEG